jgi:hypothetical protein
MHPGLFVIHQFPRQGVVDPQGCCFSVFYNVRGEESTLGSTTYSGMGLDVE